MTRARVFSKAEIMDAARAAAETGLSVKLCPTGEIIFSPDSRDAPTRIQTPEEVLAEWLLKRQLRQST